MNESLEGLNTYHRIKILRIELMQLRLKASMKSKSFTNTSAISKTKRKIARALTLINSLRNEKKN